MADDVQDEYLTRPPQARPPDAPASKGFLTQLWEGVKGGRTNAQVLQDVLTGVAGGAAGVLTRQPDYAPNLLQGVRAKRATDQYKRQIENLARAWQIPVPQDGFPATTRITDLIAMLPQYQPVAGVGLVEEQLGQPPRLAIPAQPKFPSSLIGIMAQAAMDPTPENIARANRAADWEQQSQGLKARPFLTTIPGPDNKPQRALVTTGGQVTPLGPAPEKPEKKVGETGKYYMSKSGEVAPGDMTVPDALKAGFSVVDPVEARRIPAVQQSLTMLNTISDQLEKLRQTGKIVQAQGLRAVWDATGLRWEEFSGDPDLQQFQSMSSDMIALMRTLGDKGARAQAAYEGAMTLITSRRMNYQAVRKQLDNMDKILRSGAPKQVPDVFKDIPSFRDKPAQAQPNLPPGWSIEPVP